MLQDREGRYVRFGVGGKGASDLLGWDTVEVTEDMVGQKVAIVCAIEVKPEGEHPTPEQVAWLCMVSEAGGRAGVAHSPDEALEIIKGE